MEMNLRKFVSEEPGIFFTLLVIPALVGFIFYDIWLGLMMMFFWFMGLVLSEI